MTSDNTPTQDPAPRVLMRFGTLCGAVVSMVEQMGPCDDGTRLEQVWLCHGCGRTAGAYVEASAIVADIREGANKHSGQCRSMPDPAAGEALMADGDLVVGRYLTAGGGIVTLFQRPSPGNLDHGWACGGCGDATAVMSSPGNTARTANHHAADCRAIPDEQPTPQG